MATEKQIAYGNKIKNEYMEALDEFIKTYTVGGHKYFDDIKAALDKKDCIFWIEEYGGVYTKELTSARHYSGKEIFQNRGVYLKSWERQLGIKAEDYK